MKAGFGWENGPFEIWDAIGIDKGIELIKQEQGKISDWLHDFVSSDFKGFYTVKEGKTWYYDIPSKSYKVKPGQESYYS